MSRLFDDRARRRNLAAAYRDIAAQQKWFWYAKASGMFLPDYEEDNFFSEEQERFFAEYERGMDEA
jgi:hypothetical protein